MVPIVYADTGQPSGNVYYARYFVIGVDTASGRVVWTSDGAGRAATPETIAIERAGSTIAGRDRCARVGVVRVSDGMWLGHMDQPQQGTGCDGQFDYQYGGGAVIGRLRKRSPLIHGGPLVPLGVGRLLRGRWISARAGRR